MANQSECPHVVTQMEANFLTPVLTLDVVLGLIGNSVALWIFCFKLKSWNPNTIFLFNLVIADFMALVSLPLWIDARVRTFWGFGDIICRIDLFLAYSNRSASIAMMTLVATYRYLKVVHPHSYLARLSSRHALLLSALLWTLVIIPRVPMLAFSHIKSRENKTQCFFFASYSKSPHPLLTSHRAFTVLEFLVPFLILVFCCVRISAVLRARTMGRPGKGRKAMRVCAVVVAVFVVCFLPTSITTVGIWVINTLRPWDCPARNIFTYLNILSLGLNFLNSALDPILYVFSSSVFRRELVKCLPKWVKCRRKDQKPDQSETETSDSQSTTQQELRSIRAGPDLESSQD